VNYNDVDLCLRVAGSGLSVLVDPRVEMTHRECQTRQGGTTLAERLLFRERWRKLLAKPDPYYPEAYDRTTEEVRLAIP
jgi:GT2 family glycosyltransferase